MQSDIETKGVPPPYPEHPPPLNQSVIKTQHINKEDPAVIVVDQVGPIPTNYICKSCHAEITTRVERTRTKKTHLSALLLCVIGGLLCVWIPYCMDSCHDLKHYCPNCDAYIGTYGKN